MQITPTGFFSNLKNYSFSKLQGDLMAGITVAVMLIPQGMAYAMLAGLPPIYGLYAGLVPLLTYPLFGSSRHLSIGPAALVSILVLSGLGDFANPMSPEFINLAILTAFVAGVIQLGLAIFRMGFLVKFLSNAVLDGFTSAAAIIIGLSQIKNILGLDLGRTSTVIDTIENLLWNLHTTHMPTFMIGLASVVFILICKKVKRSFPSALVVVILGTFCVYYFQLHEKGVPIVGYVPAGLPMFQMPDLYFDSIKTIFPSAVIICLISFIESLAIAKAVAGKNENYPIDANKELMGLGFSKILGSFFQAYPTTASFTRSVINDSAGAKTGLSSIFSACIIGLTLLFLSTSIYYLPKAVLAAIVIAAVIGLVNISKAKFYYKTSKHDFWVMIITFTTTLFLGVQSGILLGIILSIGYILHRSSKPFYAVLGYLEGTTVFRNIARFPDAKQREDLLIIRFNASIYFGNSEYFREIIWSEIRQRTPKITYLVLDFSSIPTIDASGLQMFDQIINELHKDQITLVLTNVQGPTRDRLTLAGLLDKIGIHNQFLINKDAYTYTENPHGRHVLKMKYANQTDS